MWKTIKQISNFVIYLSILFMTIFIIFSLVYPTYIQRIEKQKESDKLSRELNSLKEENKKLSQEVRKLHTSSYVETIARSSLGLIKEGEVAYIVVESEKKQEKEPVEEVKEEEQPFYVKWFSFFQRFTMTGSEKE